MKKTILALGLISATAAAMCVAAPPQPAARRAGASRSGSAPLPLHLPAPTVEGSARRPDMLLPREFLPTSALHAGMKGYGLSVFHGNKIERFDVTILGLLRKVNSGRDLILVRLGGPNMSRVSDVVAGMSGSPVYIDGRIVGAVSYGMQFTKEPMGFLTPIEDMLDAWDPALPQSPIYELPRIPANAVGLAQPIRIEGHVYRSLRIAAFGDNRRSVAGGSIVARPCLTPLNVAGVTGSRFARIAETLRKFGLDARQGPGSTMNPGLRGSAMQPGGALGMSLLTGDIDMTGIGTLTYRRGDRIVAFGHPFLGVGPVDAPMFTAYIHDLLPSYSESQKIGSPVKMVGSFSQDRPFSIGGRIGATPNLVPITVHVTDHVVGRDRVFRARMVRHPQLTPALATMAAGTAIANVHGLPGDAMATVTTEVVADEVGLIRRTNRVFDAQAIDEAATGDLTALIGVLTSNPFYPLGIRSVNLNVTIDRGRQTAQVERIFLKQTKFAPGDTIDVGIVLKPYKNERVTRMLQVKIPPATPSGTLMLTVQGGSGNSGGIRLGGITFLPSGSADSGSVATVAQLVRKYEERDRNDALVAHLALPTAAVSVEGEKLSGLPANLEEAMRGGTRTSGLHLERDEVKVSELTPYVLSGAQALPIRVVRADQPTPGSVVPPAGAPGGSILITPPSPAAVPPPQGAPVSVASDSSLIGVPSGMASQSAATTLDLLPTEFGSDSGDDVGETVSTSIVRIVRAGTPAPTTIPTAKSTVTPTVAGAPVTAAPRLVGRPAGIWRQTTAADFRQGKLDGVTVTSVGDVRLAPRLTRITETTEPYFWSLAEGESGTVYAGSGDGGAVYRIGSDGKAVVWSRTGELEVQSLARGADGTLYAGTAPNGRVFRIGPDGKATLFVQSTEKYVLALALSPDGNTLYAATGGPTARVYAIPTGGGKTAATRTMTRLYTSAESSVTALVVGRDGAVYAGTSPGALVVKVAGPGGASSSPAILYDARQQTITGLALGADNALYAATAPRGVVYRVDPSGGTATRVVYDKTPNAGPLTGLQNGPVGTLYTASGATVIEFDPANGTARTFDADSDIQILSLLRAGDGRLLVATGNTAGLYRLERSGAATRGTLVSGILDTQATARWGTIRWTGDVPAGARLTFETRSGSTSEPDEAWSSWSHPYTAPSGEPVASPAGRYLQYRATLHAAAPGETPALRDVEVYYQSPNQPPQVTLIYPRGGEVLRGRDTIRWSGTDPDRDTLTYAVALSGDGGRTWKPLSGPEASSTPAASTPAAPRTGSTAAAQGTVSVTVVPPSNNPVAALEAELARHPEISPELRARMLADAPAPGGVIVTTDSGISIAPSASPTVGAIPGATRDTSSTLDTGAFPDGTYFLRVTASDRPSNPVGALTDEKASPEFRIANHPPTMVLFKHGMATLPDHTVRLEGIALHPSVAIRGVQYRVDGGEWLAAAANDGIFDSRSESFTLVTLPLPVGTHHIEVQAQDEAGNTVTQQATVVVR